MNQHVPDNSTNKKTVHCYVIDVSSSYNPTQKAGKLLSALYRTLDESHHEVKQLNDAVAVTISPDLLPDHDHDASGTPPRPITSSATAAKCGGGEEEEEAEKSGVGDRFCGVGCVVFHPELKPGCADAEGSVVVGTMRIKKVGSVAKVGEARKVGALRKDITAARSLAAKAQRMGARAPLILVNFSAKQTGLSQRDDEPYLSPLWVAFNVNAVKLLKYNGMTERSLKVLILSVTQAANAVHEPFRNTPNRPVPSITQTLPQEGLIDIAWMTLPTVHSLLLLLSGEHRSFAENVTSALRAWVKAGNWPAVRELCLSCNNICTCSLGMEEQILDCVPPQLEGISCGGLDLSDNKINKIPEWLLHSRIPWVELNNNPLKSLPPHLRSLPWEAIKSFLLFGEIPIKVQPNTKIVMMGGPHHLNYGLLKCLMENQPKRTMRSNTKSTPVIQVHQPFKLERTDPYTWTAWELGGSNEDWNPFYPCFFNSNSVFILTCDVSLNADVVVPKLHFWLTQLHLCHNNKAQSMHCTPIPKVILVGFYQDIEALGGDKNAQLFLHNLFPPIIHKWQSNINFCGWFAVNLAEGNGFSFSNEVSDRHIPFQNNIMFHIRRGIQSQIFAPMYVPPSWVKLHDLVVGTVTTKNPTLKLSQLARIAHDCGVGRNKRTMIPVQEQEEMRMCFDWLSNMGAIFHLRYTSFMGKGASESNNNEFVVLQPSWFTETITSITRSVASVRATPDFVYEPLRTEHQAIDLATLEDLTRLGMMMEIFGKPYMSFFLLPADPKLVEKCFWNHVKTSTPVHGCRLKFGFLPAEAFSTVMCSLCNVPGVIPVSFWRNGIWVKMETPQTFHLLMIRAVAKVTQETTVEVAMITDLGDSMSRFSWKNNLMSTTVNLLKRTARSMIQNPSLNPMFVCPKCLKENKPAIPDWQNCLKRHISHKEIMETDLGRDRGPTLDCEHPYSSIRHEMAPEDLYNPISFMTSRANVGLGYTMIWECYSGGAKNSPPQETATTVLHTSSSEPDKFIDTLLLLTPELNTLNYLPGHEHVATFVGMPQRDGKMLLRFLERQPSVIPPPHLLPATTRGPVEEPSSSEVLSLSALLKVCLEYPREHKGALDEALPMCLWEHILKDVAQGLNHLHGQHPPIAHGDICVGNVLVTSLDLAGSGPWAKITYGVFVDDDNPRKIMGEDEKPVKNTTPEAVIQGNTLPSTQGDVWDFGILVHNVIAPLSLVDLRSTSSQPAPHIHYSRTQPSSMRKSTTKSDPQFSRRHGTQVERFQVGRVLASGAFVVDADRCATNCGSSYNNKETALRQKKKPKQLLPIWARQLISLCLVADPLQRPSMEALIRVWHYFGGTVSAHSS